MNFRVMVPFQHMIFWQQTQTFDPAYGIADLGTGYRSDLYRKVKAVS